MNKRSKLPCKKWCQFHVNYLFRVYRVKRKDEIKRIVIFETEYHLNKNENKDIIEIYIYKSVDYIFILCNL